MCRLDESFREERCGRCRQVFAICRGCDNGQIYCRPVCASEVRTASKRRARARHQASPLGRKDHRDHQRAYRARQRKLRSSVTDQGSKKVDAPTKVPMPAQLPVTTPVAEAPRGGSDLNGLKRDLVHCAFCGRTSGWIRRGKLRRRDKIRESG